MEAILSKLANLEHDKLLHFFYGYFIFKFVLLFGNILIALGVVSIVAIFKEIYDYKHPDHNASFMDFVFTVLTGVTETLIWFIL